MARGRKKGAKKKGFRLRFPNWANWAILGVVIVASAYWIYISFFAGPPIYQLPANITYQPQGWMTFVPSDTSYLQFYNYTSILESPAGLSALKNDTALYLSDNGYNLTATNTTAVFGVWFTEQIVVNVFQPKPQTYWDFYSIMNSTVVSVNEKGILYFFPSPQEPKPGLKAFLVFYDGFVFYGEGGTAMQQLIAKLINTHNGLEPSFFTPERQVEYYLITNTRDHIMGLNFLPGASTAGTHEIVTIAYDSGGYISLSNYYAYKTQADAINFYPQAKQSFFQKFYSSYIIGNFIEATRTFKWEDVTTVLSMI